jgi:exopolyphosphatase / guanosine-5'-triphosphate,3'-diphosphate pyrophosphatase
VLARALAAVDCGTNSTRLLVADASGRPLERLMRITRLGYGVDRTKALDPGAIDRTVAVLREYRTVMDDLGVGAVRITATSAARDATNREDFFAAATEAVGARPELLGGEAEGALSFAGATAELDPAAGPYLVVDIGGGSTELAVGPDPARAPSAPIAVRSLDVGCVRLTERFLHGDPPTGDEIAAAAAHVDALLRDATDQQPALRGASRMVGLAGTVASLAALDQGLVGYDRDRLHHYALSRRSVEHLLAGLAGESVEARRRRPGMEAARADVIVGGALVLDRLLRHFSLDGCVTSEADILDGLIMSLRSGAGRG